MRVRGATSADLAEIVVFNQNLAWESEQRRIATDVLTLGVELALRSPEKCLYFVAEIGGQVVGQTMVTFEVTDWENGLVWWMQSVFVRPENRGQGVFRSLYEHVLSRAKAAGNVRRIRLYVEKDNGQAIATYQRLGMVQAHFYIYERRLSDII